MGLWVDRMRVTSAFTVSDPNGREVKLSGAECRITPVSISWLWPKVPKFHPSGYHFFTEEDNKTKANFADLTLFFASESDTLFYLSRSGYRVEGYDWIKEYDPQLFPQTVHRDVSYLLGSGADGPYDPTGFDHVKAHHRSGGTGLIQCSDTVFSNAVRWAHTQLLNLLAEHDSLLYAGIPWFNEGWGRDTFISLPGLLVTGHTDVARKLLMRFAGWIDRDPNSPTYGRIPNRVRPGEEIVYNTADGTPWWILGCYQYGLYARDYEFWRPLLGDSGAITLALDGALAKCDTFGFLTHSDADTWMDAVGEKGPWSPRGNRAVEVQTLHHASLDAAVRMAEVLPQSVSQATLDKRREAKRKIERNFFPEFLAPTQDRFYDHLNSNGSPDTLFRPNQLYAATVPLTPLIPPLVQTRMVEQVSSELIERYGVLSLSPQSPLFHPFHQDEHYPKDAAYHNGTVWVFLSGPAKTALVKEGRADLALQLAEYEANLALTRGCVGSLPELLDAMPRKGEKEPALSGTVSQAWSLAEFLRTLYQDILGIRPVRVKGKIEPFWLFDPRVPETWGKTTARVTLEGTPILVTIQNHGDSMSVEILPQHKPAAPVGIKVFDEHNGITGYLNEADTIRFVYRQKEGIAYADGHPTAQLKMTGWPYDKGNQDIKLASPIKQQKFITLAPPPWDVLTAKEALDRTDHPIEIASAVDSVGDDVGAGNYTYPLDDHFKRGILDLIHFSICRNEKGDMYYFSLQTRNLINPGWHPEYGFQLTFAAIALHTPDAKRTDAGSNSYFILEKPASRIVYVGGGFRLDDDSGQTLAQFTPRTSADAFADTSKHYIFFSLPRKYFPKDMTNASWTVLIGAQDDHGGAGMGEFRTVKPVAEQWAGGGNDKNGSNVYDVLRVPDTGIAK